MIFSTEFVSTALIGFAVLGLLVVLVMAAGSTKTNEIDM